MSGTSRTGPGWEFDAGRTDFDVKNALGLVTAADPRLPDLTCALLRDLAFLVDTPRLRAAAELDQALKAELQRAAEFLEGALGHLGRLAVETRCMAASYRLLGEAGEW
ncbi:hypothetical protein [Streptomyces sp. G45]|uniref:hypothetical protein n=1 Tax=Streptomyces sp. G45 TaxID=3406627 RepID=UPI003C134D77